jgi:hypothetical protein
LFEWFRGAAGACIANFSPAVIHVVKNVGEAPLRGIVIEFKPEPASAISK